MTQQAAQCGDRHALRPGGLFAHRIVEFQNVPHDRRPARSLRHHDHASVAQEIFLVFEFLHRAPRHGRNEFPRIVQRLAPSPRGKRLPGGKLIRNGQLPDGRLSVLHRLEPVARDPW